MTYCTLQDVQDDTGTNYVDTIYFLSAIAGSISIGDVITSDDNNASSTVTEVGEGYLLGTPDNNIVEIAAGGFTHPNGTGSISRVSEQSTPTRQTVLRIISRTGNIIDDILAKNGIDVPVTSSNATANTLQYLKEGQMFGVMSKVEREIYVQDTSNESRRGETWGAKWSIFLEELRKKPELINSPSRLASCFTPPQVTRRDQIT